MQTLIKNASLIIGWTRLELANGVYRICDCRWIEHIPDTSGLVELTGHAQWECDLDDALAQLGHSRDGQWIGGGMAVDGGGAGVGWLYHPCYSELSSDEARV